MLALQVLSSFDPSAAKDITIVDFITPFLPLIGTIIGGMVIGLFALWNRKRGATEQRMPDVNEIWLQQRYQMSELEQERRLRWSLEDAFSQMRRAFHGYVERVTNGGSHVLTKYERIAYNLQMPSADTIKHSPPLSTQERRDNGYDPHAEDDSGTQGYNE